MRSSLDWSLFKGEILVSSIVVAVARPGLFRIQRQCTAKSAEVCVLERVSMQKEEQEVEQEEIFWEDGGLRA
jgi:hypothetical protein